MNIRAPHTFVLFYKNKSGMQFKLNDNNEPFKTRKEAEEYIKVNRLNIAEWGVCTSGERADVMQKIMATRSRF